MLERFFKWLILRLLKSRYSRVLRTKKDETKRYYYSQNIVTWDSDKQIVRRFQPFWLDEYVTYHKGERKHFHRPPWYRPFNILLHRWIRSDDETFHDHPRWSITICLRGKLIEHTPKKTRVLTPGSIVFRSHKAIHRFDLPQESRSKTWTLFIVGRRSYKQNTYKITNRGIT